MLRTQSKCEVFLLDVEEICARRVFTEKGGGGMAARGVMRHTHIIWYYYHAHCNIVNTDGDNDSIIDIEYERGSLLSGLSR